MVMGIADVLARQSRGTLAGQSQGLRLGSNHTNNVSVHSTPTLDTRRRSRRIVPRRKMVRVQSFIPPHIEPENALSLPTWAVHTSSVFEWGLAMRLMWKYGEVSGNPRWKGMSWGMLPCLGSAMCACTWHFFYNATELEFLVALQALLTIVGNATCWMAAYRIYKYSSSKDDGDDGNTAGDLMLASEE